jgi:plasmid replication initiation protein
METLLQRYDQATMHNFLVHAPLNLTYVEARLFSLALACIHKRHKELPTITIKFSEVFERDSGSNYEALEKACEGLMSKVVKLRAVNSKRKVTEMYNIIKFMKLDSGTGLIVGTFNDDIAPYLLSLVSNFTTVQVETLLTLKSPHTHRLIWFLKAHEYEKAAEISIDNLRKHLFGEEEQPSYADYFDFKRKVLLPTLAEINDPVGINWSVQMEEVKAGLRRVIGLRFTIPDFPGEPKKLARAMTPKQREKALRDARATKDATEVVAIEVANAGEISPFLAMVREGNRAQESKTPPASVFAERIQKRLGKLKLTPSQIDKVIKLVGDDQVLVNKFMSATYPLLTSYESSPSTHPNIGGETVKLLKTEFPLLYPDKEFA